MSEVTTLQCRTSPSGDPRQQDARPVTITPEAIRARAYEIYRTRIRSGAPDDPVSDWLEAERELKAPSRSELLMRGDDE